MDTLKNLDYYGELLKREGRVKDSLHYHHYWTHFKETPAGGRAAESYLSFPFFLS